jgi:hypothetical protein
MWQVTMFYDGDGGYLQKPLKYVLFFNLDPPNNVIFVTHNDSFKSYMPYIALEVYGNNIHFVLFWPLLFNSFNFYTYIMQ